MREDGSEFDSSIPRGDFDSAVLLSRNSWMIPMLALAAVNVCVILVFEIYVVCKASRNTPSRRHLFLGQVGCYDSSPFSSILAHFTQSMAFTALINSLTM